MAGGQGVRAGVVGALHGAHGAGAVHHGGGHGIAAGAAGRHGGGGDLVGQVQRQVFFGAHPLGVGGGSDERQGQDEKRKRGCAWVLLKGETVRSTVEEL